MELKDVVRKLIGKINPVGETNADDQRFENLKAHCELVNDLIIDLWYVSREKDRNEYSMSRAGKYAEEFLRDTLNIKE